ncbi:MAG: AAA family ATPase [Pseudomonadales bacterium]|nr:AAA family ATPase [Pseudomonadales bacterium]
MILLLIGTSSTGKTTLAKALQKTLPGYWQYMSLDVFFAGMPDQYGGGVNGPLSEVGFSYKQKETDARISYGVIGKKVLQGMISSAITFANEGTNLIFEDMILDEEHAVMWCEALKEIEMKIIQLTASTDTLISRNANRNNPPRLSLNHVEANTLLPAGLSLDTSVMTTEACVSAVVKYVTNTSF